VYQDDGVYQGETSSCKEGPREGDLGEKVLTNKLRHPEVERDTTRLGVKFVEISDDAAKMSFFSPDRCVCERVVNTRGKTEKLIDQRGPVTEVVCLLVPKRRSRPLLRCFVRKRHGNVELLQKCWWGSYSRFQNERSKGGEGTNSRVGAGDPGLGLGHPRLMEIIEGLSNLHKDTSRVKMLTLPLGDLGLIRRKEKRSTWVQRP